MTDCIHSAATLYSRLVLLVAPIGGGKTTLLQQLADKLSLPHINVNLELSSKLLDLTQRQRTLQMPKVMQDVVEQANGDTVILDNIEILFDVQLKQDPLRILQNLFRSKTIVAAWGGSADSGQLKYGTSGHPEYRVYPIQDFLVTTPESGL